MIQKAIVVKVEITDGGLSVFELNSHLADGWLVSPEIPPTASTPGSILVIIQKENLSNAQ